jgi:ATP-dependent exoDNAse (exonuclease V) beta subunit
VDDFAMLPDSRAVLRVAVTAAMASAGTEASSPAPGPAVTANADQALVGTLVHRLFERDAGNIGGDQDLETVTARVRRLVRDDEMAGVDNLDDVSRQSALAYLALCSQPGVVSELAGAETWFEVPFSVRLAGAQAVLRGRFDCVVRHTGGRIVVLEFKTGRPAAQHQRQLDAYLTAARALFPDSVVDGRLVYAPDAPLPHIRARLSGETQD